MHPELRTRVEAPPAEQDASDDLSWVPPIPGAWVRDFRLGEWLGDPVTPLFESWALTRIEERFNAFYARLLGLEPPRPGHVVVNGWYFYGLNFLPESRAALAALLVRCALPRLIRSPRRTAIAFPPLARFAIRRYEAEWRSDVLPRYRRVVSSASSGVAEVPAAELVAIIDELADAAGDYFVYVTAVGGYAWKSELRLATFYARHLAAAIGGSHLDLLAGLHGGVVAMPGHAVRSIDWAEPTAGESGDGTGSEDGARARHAAARERRLQVHGAARAALSRDPKHLRSFERLLADAQHHADVREEVVGAWTLPWTVFRRALLRLADELVRHDVLEGPDDIWFIRREELVAALGDGVAVPLGVPAERRATWMRQRRLAPPLRLGHMPSLIRSAVESAERAIRGNAFEPLDDADAIVVGLPASGGRASGRVRVVRSIDEFDDVRPGEVLVAPMTAPAWTVLFDRVVAIVTDTGGATSHASIVAREYGLPAVVGTRDATHRLRAGDLVEVDGGTGIVRRIAAPPTPTQSAVPDRSS